MGIDTHVEVRISVMVGSEEFTFLDEAFAPDGPNGADTARVMLNSLKIVACRALGFPEKPITIKRNLAGDDDSEAAGS